MQALREQAAPPLPPYTEPGTENRAYPEDVDGNTGQ